MAFVANYNVSNAELIIPAADLSEQISTAGTEASGTGNMKLALNGALTIGTLDGANIEMRDEVGADNMFIFGMTAAEVAARRQAGYNPAGIYDSNPDLRRALDMIATGFFTPEAPRRFLPIFERLTTFGDYFMLLADYADYVDCQARVDDVVPAARRMGAPRDSQRRRDGQLLERSNGSRLRAGSLEHQSRLILTDWIVIGLSGRSPGLLVAVAPIFSMTSMPSATSPNTVCLLSSHGVAASVMKNWLPFVFGPALAIDSMPAFECRACTLNSSPNL